MVECFAAGDVVHKQRTGGTAIIRARNGTERLLAGSVPNLQFNLFAIDGDHSGAEFDTDSEIVNGLKALVGELQ